MWGTVERDRWGSDPEDVTSWGSVTESIRESVSELGRRVTYAPKISLKATLGKDKKFNFFPFFREGTAKMPKEMLVAELQRL